jgi:hypothetical protein
MFTTFFEHMNPLKTAATVLSSAKVFKSPHNLQVPSRAETSDSANTPAAVALFPRPNDVFRQSPPKLQLPSFTFIFAPPCTKGRDTLPKRTTHTTMRNS